MCRQCRQAATDAARPDCGLCGTRLRPRQAKYCSVACANKVSNEHRRGRERVLPECEVCGTGFVKTYGGQLTCGRECVGELQRRNRALKPPPPPKLKPTVHCSVCGTIRADGERWRSYCSAQCTIDASGMRVKDLYATAVALKLGGAPWLRLLMTYLRERDGDKCSLCHRRIRFDLKSGPTGHPSGLGPSVDHIVPRSVEINDDPANLRLAHWKCNYARRTGRPGEVDQLALVG